MKIRITAGGIHGANGELKIGDEVTVKNEPVAWAGRYVIIDDSETEDKTFVTGDSDDEDGKDTKAEERAELKKQADELGIEYPKNVKNEKLQELINAKLAE